MMPRATTCAGFAFTRRKRMYSLLYELVESCDSQYEIVSALLGTPGLAVYVVSG